MLFSVIIPVYNTGEDLRRSLDSILVQKGNFSDYEVVVVNDGSYDQDTLSILAEYDSRYDNMKLIHQKNGGGVAARRRGIDESQGRYITFIDSDDEVTSDYMQTLHDIVQEQADIYIFNNYLVNQGQNTKIEKVDCPHGGDKTEYVLRRLFKATMNAVWDKIYYRDVFIPVKNSLPESIMFGDDMYMNFQYISLRKIQKAVVVEKPIYYHYVGTGKSVSDSKSTIKRIADTKICLMALEQAAQHYSEINLLENCKDFCYGYMVRHLRNISKQGDGVILKSNPECDFSAVKIFKATGLKGFCYRLALKSGCYKWV